MSWHRRKIVLFLIFSLALGFFSYALAIIPPYIDRSKIRLSLDPEEISYGEIVITNPNTDAKHMRLYLEDWSYLPLADGTKEFAPANTTAYSCASWITFSPAEFDLAPFGKQQVSFSVKAPQQAKGGYYAVLFFESMVGGAAVSAGQGLGAGLNLAIRMGALFYVEIKDGLLRAADLGDLNFKKEGKLGYSLELDFKNTGNTDITAGGSFHIIDKKGIIYARGEFDKVYTFTGGKGKLKSNWKEAIPKGKYDLVLTVDIGKALEEADLGRGPIIIKEGEVEIGQDGQVLKVGRLE